MFALEFLVKILSLAHRFSSSFSKRRLLSNLTAMNDENCGFTLYAQNLRQKIGGRHPFGATAYEAAIPGWKKLRAEDKQLWTNRARGLQRSEHHQPHKRYNMMEPCTGTTPQNVFRGSIENYPSATSPFFYRSPNKNQTPANDGYFSNGSPHMRFYNGKDYRNTTPVNRYHVFENKRNTKKLQPMTKSNYMEIDEEDEWGVGAPEVSTELDEKAFESVLNEKYNRDMERIIKLVKKKTNGCPDKIKKIRWILCSMQTFGYVDGICIPAEMGLCEFDLTEGILDKFSSIIGPWEVSNDVQRSRSTFHSNETHGIPLEGRGTVDKTAAILEVLGRTEPKLAAKQGVRIGLYHHEIDDESRGYYHVEHREKRRFVVCLRQEFHYIQASFKHLKNEVGLHYDGVPMVSDDFVLADALVDALAVLLKGNPLKEYSGWLLGLGMPLPRELITPWERNNGELFCARHRPGRNSCCAAVTVSRATYIILYALDSMLK
ncbi:unnamed protein product, partial [Mesorhabditis belari]|uniref:Maelstrom domain-containing protein n=1 Tax=Mesorhabditis belari TaxID=2138241 RepID=A0AAF3FDS2_9BILA